MTAPPAIYSGPQVSSGTSGVGQSDPVVDPFGIFCHSDIPAMDLEDSRYDEEREFYALFGNK